MKFTLAIFILLSSLGAKAQTQAAAALEKDAKTLTERYAVMKDKSETFNEYKVIKEYILDGMWKLTTDSIKKVHSDLAEA
ncbi:MAG: hypothetical protein RIF39_04560 [Cyclobacteriaceae bacterium]